MTFLIGVLTGQLICMTAMVFWKNERMRRRLIQEGKVHERSHR